MKEQDSMAADCRKRLVSVCGLLLVAAGIASSSAGSIPGAVATTISDSERDLELRAVAVRASGKTTEVIAFSRPKGRVPGAHSLLWVTLKPDGRIASRQDLVKAMEPADLSKADLDDSAAGTEFVVSDDTPFMVMSKTTGGLHLLRMTQVQGGVVTQPIDLGTGSPIVRRTIVKENGNLLLLGAIDGRPMVAEIDTEGELIAEHDIDLPGLAVTAAVIEPRGTMVLGGEQGVDPETVAWVGRISRQGELMAQASFPGQLHDLASGNDGSYLVVTRQGELGDEDIRITALDSGLNERWSRTLVGHQRLSVPFRIVPVVGGGAIVAGAKDRGLWVSRLGQDGSELWTEVRNPHTSPDMEMVSNVELVSNGGIFVVAYTAFVVEQREQREVVRAIRFTAD